jgi:hypothetical protein
VCHGQLATRASTGSALSVGKEMIDHLMWKLAILAGALALFVALGGGAVLVLLRSKNSQR